MKFLYLLFVLFLALSACQPRSRSYDLVIRNARVFDSRTATVLPQQTVCIRDGRIVAVTDAAGDFAARRTLDARGRLLTPGFVDTHIHPTDVFGDYAAAPAYLPADSLNEYRTKLTREYVPYGVTTALMMGQPQNWLAPILDWVAKPAPQHLELYTTGGALISKEERPPYVNHRTVGSAQQARKQVQDYYRQGLRHIKLYWRLRGPEFRAALATADSLGMRSYAHLDQNVVNMDTALALGLRHFEHLLTLDHGVLAFPRDADAFTAHMRRHYGEADPGFVAVRLEMFRFIREQRAAEMDGLLRRLAARRATFSTSLHVLAEPLQLAYFAAQRDTTLTPGRLSPVQLARGQENFRLLLRYAKQLADQGVALRLGTDCAKGGQAVQSEQLLLFEHGFTVAQILQISTRNGATALGLEREIGTVEAGQRANLVLFDHDPFADYRHFRSTRTIIKDGAVWHP